MPTIKFLNLHKQNQTAYHNLCETIEPPKDIGPLLWNGLKFRIEKPLPKPNINNTFERLTKDIRLKCFWLNTLGYDEGNFNPKLYKPSGFTPPKSQPSHRECPDLLPTEDHQISQ